MAKTGDELLRLESDRIIQAVESSQQVAPSQDITWAPPRARYVLERLLAPRGRAGSGLRLRPGRSDRVSRARK